LFGSIYLAMISFQHTSFLMALVLLVPLCLLFIWVLRWKNQTKKRIGDEQLVNALTANYAARYFRLKFILMLAVVALSVIAAANLRMPKATDGGKRAGIDVMVALDVSNSMLAQDVKPNRLERAKQVLNRLVDKIGDNRLGLVVFAGQAYLQMPLTADLAAAKLYIANAAPNAVSLQGTMVGEALKLCDASLDTKEKKYKAVVLISDGEDHDENAGAAVKQLAESGVIVHTIGIGSPAGAPILDTETGDYKKDSEGNTVSSKLNEQELKNLAEKTGGTYQLFSTADEVAANLLASFDNMEKKQVGTGEQREYTTFFQWFVALALLLVIFEIVVPERKMKWFA